MKSIVSLFLVAVLFLALAVPAGAHPCRGGPRVDPCLSRCNPDARASITLTGGLGQLNGASDADLTNLGVALVYPTTRSLSLLARFDHSEAEWDVAGRHGWPTPGDFTASTWTIGVRFYLGR